MQPPTWPAQFTVAGKTETFRGAALGPNSFSFESGAPFSPGWLADLSLDCGGVRLKMLANVRACDKTAKGFLVTAQPFALGGDEKAAWINIVTRTRPAP